MIRRVVTRLDDRRKTCVVIKGIKAEITALRVKCRANVRTEYDLVSVISQNFESHGVANMLGDAHKIASALTTVGWKMVVINHVVDGFIPLELQQGTDVIGGTSKNLDGDAAGEGLGRGVIEEETDVHEAQEPQISRGPSAVEDSIGKSLDSLIASFGRVLMLLEGFALPIRDTEGT
jgi:hypothetical protein